MEKSRNTTRPALELKGKLTDQEVASYIVTMTKELMDIARSRKCDGLADMLREPYFTAFAILAVEGVQPGKAARSDLDDLR